MTVSNVTVILGTQVRSLKTKPILLTFLVRTSHAQLLNALAAEMKIKPHRWAWVTHERVFLELLLKPRDIHIDGTRHLSWKALEVLRDLWDETESEEPRQTIRIVMNGDEGFVRKIAKRHPQLADRVRVYP
jgi:type II secretory pathway predicted ATPase ExeA